MEDPMYEVIDENELLPELEIEEALTLEQMLAFQPRFVAFSDQDILAYLHQLIKSTPQRAEMFARLHREVVGAGKSSPVQFSKVVITPYGLSRKDLEDENFIQEMMEAKQASSYTVQQMGIDRVMFPFTLDEDSSTHRPIIENDADIELTPSSYSRILKTDPVQVPIESARWKISTKTQHPDYLFDAALPTQTLPSIPWNMGDDMEVMDWIMKKVRPSIDGVLQVLNEAIDVHTLHRVLAKYGYDVQKLNGKDFGKVRKHVRELYDKDPVENEDPVETATLPSPKFTKIFVNIADVIKHEGTRATILNNDDNIMKLQEKYQSILQSIPPLPQQLPLSSPIEIAKELRSGTSTIESVSEQLIQWYLRWFLDNITRYMERFSGNKVEIEAFDKYIRHMQHVGESILVVTSFDFVRRYSDIAEVKEGNDTSMYDGAPSFVPETVFEETMNEEFIARSSQDESADIDALNLFENAVVSESTAASSEFEVENLDRFELTLGQKEVIRDICKQLYRVHIASGLPIQIQSIVQWCKQYIARASRVQQIMTAVPGISEVVAARIVHEDIQVVSERIQDLHTKSWRDALQQSYKNIHEEWRAAYKDALILMMTRWWIELCDQSLRGTLQFTPLQGMMQHMHMWSSYGPPMQADAKSGIFFYLTEVAETVIQSDARSARDTMKALAVERMQKDVDELKEKWNTLQVSEHVLSQSDRARLLLENTIKALKSGQGAVDILAGYLPGILYLPQLLPAKRVQKKAASWIQGCCATPLDETFQADNDWRTQLSALYKIKRFLAKERWSLQTRAVLNGFTKDAPEERANDPTCSLVHTSHPLHDSQASSEIFAVNMQEEAWQWIPRSHMDMLTRSPNQVEGWAKSIVEKIYFGERSKSTLVFRVISKLTSVSSLMSFLNRIGKNLQEKVDQPEIANTLSQMKSCLRNIPSGKVSSSLIMYACTMILAMPASVDQASLSMPPEITRQDITAIWNKNYQVCVEWNNVGFMMNTSDVQAFITKVREQQKEISLQRLDILSIEDRQTLLDAKNLGLLRIVEFSEIDPDRELDMEGEQDFAMESGDADQDGDTI